MILVCGMTRCCLLSDMEVYFLIYGTLMKFFYNNNNKNNKAFDKVPHRHFTLQARAELP